LDEFEGGAGAITFLFGETIPLVETAFAVLKLVSTTAFFALKHLYLFLDCHGFS